MFSSGNHFVTTNSTAGSLYIWDVSRLCIIKQINLHQGIINRVVYHPGGYLRRKTKLRRIDFVSRFQCYSYSVTR